MYALNSTLSAPVIYQQQFSPNHIDREITRLVMRIEELISNKKVIRSHDVFGDEGLEKRRFRCVHRVFRTTLYVDLSPFYNDNLPGLISLISRYAWTPSGSYDLVIYIESIRFNKLPIYISARRDFQRTVHRILCVYVAIRKATGIKVTDYFPSPESVRTRSPHTKSAVFTKIFHVCL